MASLGQLGNPVGIERLYRRYAAGVVADVQTYAGFGRNMRRFLGQRLTLDEARGGVWQRLADAGALRPGMRVDQIADFTIINEALNLVRVLGIDPGTFVFS